MNIIDIVSKKGVFAVDYISTIEAGEKWNLSHRRVAILCAEDRIPGVKKIGNTWLIPANDKYEPIKVTEDNSFRVWGVITSCIKRFHKF